MNKYQNRRWHAKCRWLNSHPQWNNEWKHSRPEIIEAQEQLTREIQKYCIQNETEKTAGAGLHYHRCTFAMISNDKQGQNSQCNKWRQEHNIQVPLEFDNGYREDACDWCPMMNYIALDDEGKVMYVSRTFPEDRDVGSYRTYLTF